MIQALKGHHPKIAKTSFIAPGAHVIGMVELDEVVSIWYNTVLRADADVIKIGKETNIQDLSVLHEDEGYPLIIGERVTVGHKCILHGCTIGDGALIGMGTTVLNGAKIGECALIGAGALVPAGKVIPPRTLAMGVPAKVVRDLTPEEIEDFQKLADTYHQRGQLYKAELEGAKIK